MEFLGTGTSTGVPTIGCDCPVCRSEDPHNKRLRCSVWIQTETTSVLVDTGPDFRTQILRAGIRQIDGVIITHYHADHVVGIDDLRRFNFLQKAPIDCFADARTLGRLNQCFDYIFSDDLRPGLPNLRRREVAPGRTFDIGDLQLEPLALDHHVMPSMGLLIAQAPPNNPEAKKARLAYCVDCKRIPEESLNRIRDVDILILDMLRENPHPTHLSLKEALDLVKDIQPKQTYFSHMAHEVDHGTLQAQLPEGISLAYDGLVLNTNPA